jgi:hypothetical protein
MNRMAINDRYEYINEEFISERLKCTICSNPSIEPVKTKCKPREHTFCRYCIEQWLQHDSTCPSCRQTLKIQYLTPITEGILLGMLNELSVQCLFCKKTGLERGDFDEHLKKVCVERNILCSSADIKCPWNGSPQLLEEHLQTCSYTALRTMLTQMMTDNKQLNEQVNQQKTLIDKLQTENRQFKEQQSIPIIKSLIESRPPEMPKRSRESRNMHMKF